MPAEHAVGAGRSAIEALRRPGDPVLAVAQGKQLAAQVRQELENGLDGSLEEAMAALRGR